MTSKLILASASSIRKQILSELGYDFSVLVSGVAEQADPELSINALVLSLARQKAEAVFAQHQDVVVLAADTLVETAAGAILFKPASSAEARANLRARSNSFERVVTGLCVCSRSGTSSETVSSTIHYRHIDTELTEQIIASGEWRGVCGGLRIEGAIGAKIKRIEGSRSNIQGLPKTVVSQLLEQHGLPWPARTDA